MLLKPRLYIFMFIQSFQLVKSFPWLFHEELKQFNFNQSTFSELVSRSALNQPLTLTSKIEKSDKKQSDLQSWKKIL